MNESFSEEKNITEDSNKKNEFIDSVKDHAEYLLQEGRISQEQFDDKIKNAELIEDDIPDDTDNAAKTFVYSGIALEEEMVEIINDSENSVSPRNTPENDEKNVEYQEWLKDKKASENLELIEGVEQKVKWSLEFLSEFDQKITPLLNDYLESAENIIPNTNPAESRDAQNTLLNIISKINESIEKIEDFKKDERDIPLNHILSELHTTEHYLKVAPDSRFTADIQSEGDDTRHVWETTKFVIKQLISSISVTKKTLHSLGLVNEYLGSWKVVREEN